MRNSTPGDEAEACRRQASAYDGKPEQLFLMRVANAFEALAAERQMETSADA